MSSSEENSGEEQSYQSGFRTWNGDDGVEGRFNKKRKGRACDICRRRKIKCDGTETVDRSCTNCIISKSQCTYAEPSKRRTNVPSEYADDLKSRVQKLEGILSELFPRANIQAKDLTVENLRRSLLFPETSIAPDNNPKGLISRSGSAATPSSDGTAISEAERSFWLHARRFHGQSSGAVFLLDALNMKMVSEGGDPSLRSTHNDVHLLHSAGLAAIANAYYLDHAPDIFSQGSSPRFTFPPDDLMDSLVSLFFDRIHWFLPLLHSCTFHSQYRSKLHHLDTNFATILLLVCATASRFSDDKRVLPTCQELDNELESEKWLHAGLDYYMEVFPFIGRPPIFSPTLVDLQKLALACMYLQGSKSAARGWSLSGLGIRLALEAGAHRRKRDATVSVESQSWSRVFWVLVTLDRLGSASTGRPWAIQDEDIDVDFPLAVDDEYWDPPDPKDAWKQPSDKPALVLCFRSILKLLEILTFTLRTVYSTGKSQLMLGLVGPDWQQRVVSEIDSALNKWLDMMPDHLRWNPQQENINLLNQSAMLNCLYYQVQTMVHRPFISLYKSNSSLSFASLAICTNAARASSHILEVHLARGGPVGFMSGFAFTSGIVLLFNIWGAKKSAIRVDPEMHLQDIFKCMVWLKAHSNRWLKSKVAWEVLTELMSAGNFPQPLRGPLPDTPVGVKRSHKSGKETEIATPHGSTISSDDMPKYIHPGQDKSFPSMTQPSGREVQPMTPATYNTSRVPEGFGDWQPTDPAVVQTDLQTFTTDLNIFPPYPELYHADVSNQILDQSTSGAQSNGTTPFGDPATSLTIQDGAGNSDSMYAWPGVQQSMTSAAPSIVPNLSFSSNSGQHIQPASQEHIQGHNGDTVQLFQTYPEALWGQDTFSMWSTAPTSFEAQDWGDFAQGVQIEEQLRLSDIFSDPVP